MNSRLEDDFIDERLVLRRQVFVTCDIDLVEDDNDGLVSEQGLNRLEQLALRFNRVTALFGKIHKVETGSSQVGERGNRLHFNDVHVLDIVIQNTGGIDNLPSKVLVIGVSDVQGLGGERVRRSLDIGTGDLVHERTLADVGETTDDQRSGVGIDRGQTVQVLSNLFQKFQGVLLSLQDGRHSTKGGSLELFGSVQTVGELEQSKVVLGDLVDQVSGLVQLTKSDLPVFLVVQDVEEMHQEGMQVFENREFGKNLADSFVDGVGTELDLDREQGISDCRFRRPVILRTFRM